MNHITIEPEECKGCRLCISLCPRGCITLASSINKMGYQYAIFNCEKRCTACGICYHVCPEPGAVTVFADRGKGAKHHE